MAASKGHSSSRSPLFVPSVALSGDAGCISSPNGNFPARTYARVKVKKSETFFGLTFAAAWQIAGVDPTVGDQFEQPVDGCADGRVE
jgi:hypothetical protein